MDPQVGSYLLKYGLAVMQGEGGSTQVKNSVPCKIASLWPSVLSLILIIPLQMHIRQLSV